MPDFTRGKIYKITSGDMTYIGSTTQPTLAKRLAQHVTDYKQWKNGKQTGVTSLRLIDTGNYEITLIELCPCGSKDELSARERFYIETIPCVNKVIPGRTNAEWDRDNIVKIREQDKAHYYANIEKHKEQKKEYYQANKEERKEKQGKYYQANKEERKEKQGKYYQLNKEKINKARREKRVEKSKLIVE